MKKFRILQILNIWRLVPAYLCVCTAPKKLKLLVIDELNHWKNVISARRNPNLMYSAALCWKGKNIDPYCIIDLIGGDYAK